VVTCVHCRILSLLPSLSSVKYLKSCFSYLFLALFRVSHFACVVGQSLLRLPSLPRFLLSAWKMVLHLVLMLTFIAVALQCLALDLRATRQAHLVASSSISARPALPSILLLSSNLLPQCYGNCQIPFHPLAFEFQAPHRTLSSPSMRQHTVRGSLHLEYIFTHGLSSPPYCSEFSPHR